MKLMVQSLLALDVLLQGGVDLKEPVSRRVYPELYFQNPLKNLREFCIELQRLIDDIV